MSETETKAVAKKVEAGLPAAMLDTFLEDAGAGTENFTQDDLQIPFLRVLQPVSPELKKKNDKYIDGAEQGDMFNTVTRQFWKAENGVRVIPCGFVKKYLEFTPYEDGGGFHGELAANSPSVLNAKREGNKEIMPNGNELVVSAQHYVMIEDPETGGWQTAILDMKSSNLKVSRQWNTMVAMQEVKSGAKSFKAPSFSIIWNLSTDERSTDMGSWQSWKIVGKQGFVDDAAVYERAKDFARMVNEGEVKAAQDPDLETDTPTTAVSEEMPF
jgi:hypothetical protein